MRTAFSLVPIKVLIFNKYQNRIVYIFYDDNQAIFSGQDDLPITGLISESGMGDHLFRLRDNLRNTLEIHNFAVERSGLGGTAKPVDIRGMAPSEVSFKDSPSAVNYTASLLASLTVDDNIDRESIIILSNRSIGHSIFSKESRAGDFTLVAGGAGKRAGVVRFRTIHEFKGLESDIVILILHRRPEELNDRARYLSDELVYVGMSRARHLLYVVNVEV